MRASAIVFTSVLVLAAFAPLALGDPGERRTERDSPRDDTLRADKRMDDERRAPKGNVTAIRFSADGTDRDNRSYELSGVGSLLCRSRENATTGAEQIHCRGRVNATLVDANGTVLKEGVIVVMLHAHQNETGEWKWHMLSLGHGKRTHAILALRGDAAHDSDGQLALEQGKGGVVVKKPDADGRMRLRLSEGQVSLAIA